MRPLSVRSLSARGIRNLGDLDLTFGAGFNVFSGDNGHGKTNLLEAIYVALTSKSFRASKMTEMLAFGSDLGSVRVAIEEDGQERHQSVGIKSGARVVRIDDKRPPTLAAYAVRSPVVVFHPGEIALSMGSSRERRRLIDRLALYLFPESYAEGENYLRATKERQRALETRGVGARDLAEWEELMVRHGTRVMEWRRRCVDDLAIATERAFEKIAAPGLRLRVAYAPSASEDAEAFRRQLEERRLQDMRRGGASVGPHRDDMAIAINDHNVRGVASQGQHRAVVLSLKSAEIDVIGRARGAHPILLLDDVSSELDRDRTEALFRFLDDHHGQVFLTTTRREIIHTPHTTNEMGAEGRLDFTVKGGVIARAQ